jgi:ATP-binding cassette, subfamily B, bacterial
MKSWWCRMGRYALPELRSLMLIGAMVLLGVAFGLLSPWPLKLIVDNVLANRPLPAQLRWIESLPGGGSRQALVGWLALATVALFLLRRLVMIVQQYLEAGAGSRMTYRLSTNLFDHLQRRSLAVHYESRTGDLIKRVTSDTRCVRELVMCVFVPSITSVVTLAGMFVVMWQLSQGLALFAVGLCLPLMMIIRAVAGPLSERRYREQELQGEMYSLAEQTLTAIPLIQAFSREQHMSDQFRGLARRTIGANLRYELAGHSFKVSTGAVTAAATACVMVFAGIAVLDHRLSVGSLLVLMAYFTALYSPIETLAYLSEGFASAKAGARRVLEILDEEAESIVEAPGAKPLACHSSPQGAPVRYENVSFGYRPNRAVLHEVSMEIRPGEIVAIVGETGAGKSTLVSLLLRLFDPWQGSIYVDGVDIRQSTLASVRQCLAYMPQQPFLLPLTIAENIAYGRPDAARSKVMKAAVAARADGFIRSLPQGYDTVIGERGVTLSAGQKQRISLARALLREARILILDEPTSALDPETEASIMEDVSELFAGRTAFVVAHRFSTIELATTAVVLEHGRVAEMGSPRDLIAQRGRFYHLHQLQFAPRPADPQVSSCA